jgi:quinol monooxygenase YgiN/quercetin dioxygenase-like cupin family protein
MFIYKILIVSFITGMGLLASASAQDPVPLYPDNYKVLLENNRVRVLEFTLRKGATEDFHSHPAAVTYVLAPFKIKFTFPDGRTLVREAKAGDVLYGEAVTHSPLNIGDTDARGILVEMKTPPEKPSDGKADTNSKMSDEGLLTAFTFIHGLEGKEEDLKNHLLSLTAPTLAESGCIKYDLYQSQTKKNEFLRFEIWRNPADLEAHKMTPHLKSSFEKRQKEGWKTEITLWNRIEPQ